MAIDTRNRRASAIGLGLAVTLVLPAPDGAVTAADRQQVAYAYAGLTAAVARPMDVCCTTLQALTPERQIEALAPERAIAPLC